MRRCGWRRRRCWRRRRRWSVGMPSDVDVPGSRRFPPRVAASGRCMARVAPMGALGAIMGKGSASAVRVTTAVCGTRTRALSPRGVVTWKCCSGRGPTAVRPERVREMQRTPDQMSILPRVCSKVGSSASCMNAVRKLPPPRNRELRNEHNRYCQITGLKSWDIRFIPHV